MRTIQSDNKGFTLLEVLVAMVILTIVCVPLLRSFATSAQTNARAKIQMKATTASENIMEQIKAMNVSELKDFMTDSGVYTVTYNDVSYTSPSGTTFSGVATTIEIDDSGLNTDFGADLPDGYYAEVLLDPIGSDADAAYPYANSLNIADLNSISARDCAIYTMESGVDARAYAEYNNRHSLVTDPDPNWDPQEDLIRDIVITTEDTGGVYTTEWGEARNTYRIKLAIKYEVSDVSAVLNRFHTETEVFLFDNTASHKDVHGIYLFYYPRYTAANVSGSERDRVTINNDANVKTDVYVTAMNNSPDFAPGTLSAAKETIKKNYLNTGKGLSLSITDPAPLDADGKGSLRLRTNLLKVNSSTNTKTPYSLNDENEYKLGFTLKYKAAASSYNGDNAIEPLSVADVDGKSLKIEETPTRIYRVSVNIYGPDSSTTPVSTMNGTKLRQED